MWKQQQQGQSKALQRAQAMLSSHRHRDRESPEHSGPWGSGMTPAQKSSDLSSLSSDAGATRMRGPRQGTPNQKGPRGQEVDPHRTSPDSGALRFLKKPAAAQDQPKESSAVSSVQLSQAAALSRLAQIEMRFGKSLSTRREPVVSPSTRLTEESDIRQQLSSHSSLISSPPALSSAGSAPYSPPLSPPLSPVCGNVLSLEELCSLDAASGESDSDHSHPSAHFRINLMDVDDLGPADLPLEKPIGGGELLGQELPEEDQVPEEEVPEEEVPEEEVPEEEVPEEEVPEEEVPEEEVPEEVPEEELPEDIPGEDYPSDFESVVPTDSVSMGSHDSEVPPSPRSESSSSSSSGSSSSSNTLTRDRSPEHRASAAPPHISRAHSQRDSTHPWRTLHVSAQCGGSCPSLGPLMEILRQQLALTSHLISSSQQHHARLLEDLGPPNYSYITLEDIVQVSGQRNPPDTH